MLAEKGVFTSLELHEHPSENFTSPKACILHVPFPVTSPSIKMEDIFATPIGFCCLVFSLLLRTPPVQTSASQTQMMPQARMQPPPTQVPAQVSLVDISILFSFFFGLGVGKRGGSVRAGGGGAVSH